MVVVHRFDEGWPRYEPEVELSLVREEPAPTPVKKAAKRVRKAAKK